MKVSQSSYYGRLATGFVVLCLSVSCNFVINKCRATIDRRKNRGSDGNEHQNVIHGNDTNNDTANEVSQRGNEKAFSLYDTINENEMLDIFNSTNREHRSNLACASTNIQCLQSERTIHIIEVTSNKNLDLKPRMHGVDNFS